ncbi:MAG: PadR family transcriptional regulator, partial [Nitrososphaerota archaeon]|nr:PadR family transcriptional regulator [Nitrososphaerota archaeon]
IYPLLYKLEEGKFISSECTQRGGRRIRYYSITEKGAQILNRLRRRFKMPVKKVLEDFIGGTRKSPL